jgi:MFS family permease
LLRLKRRTSLVAAASLFAALYAVLGAVPVSKLVLGSGNFLTASNFVTPLAGMVFGPLVGGCSALLGDLLDAYAGVISGSTGASVIAADLATVATAGLAYSGRWRWALALPAAVIALYWADPISVLFVGWVPFTWLHMVSLVPFAAALLLQRSGRMSRLNPAFVVSVTFASLLCGQLAGTLVGQELSVRIYHTLSLQAWRGLVPLFFPLYPVERALFTVVGSAVSLPVLRGIWRREHPHSSAAPG